MLSTTDKFVFHSNICLNSNQSVGLVDLKVWVLTQVETLTICICQYHVINSLTVSKWHSQMITERKSYTFSSGNVDCVEVRKYDSGRHFRGFI